tara:strand:- start:9434 stop:10891 length:1458 start_codon:yes stop_codon:yes gene_type:complete
MINDPGLLTADWTFGSSVSVHSYLYSLLISPAWVMIDNNVHAAQLIRIALWLFLIFSIAQVGKQLSISSISVFVGLILFVYFEQGFASGEWLFGGAEQKIVAYAFVFLSLSKLLGKQAVLAGIYSGIAFCFHILVGGWSGLAIGLALIFTYRKTNSNQLLKYAAGALPIVLPMMVLVLVTGHGNETSYQGMGIDYHEQLVLFRIPHHLDPFSFMDFKSTSFLLLAISLLVVGLKTQYLNSTQKFTCTYLLILSTFFLIGLVLRYFEQYRFLIAYPFRVADALLPLSLAIASTHFFLEWLKAKIFKYDYRRMTLISAILVIVVYLLLSYTEVIHKIYWTLNSKYKTLQDSSRTAKTDYGEVTNWIKDNTKRDVIFAVNPCKSDFWIKSDRAMIVNFKSSPSDARFYEWYQRLSDLNNGKEFSGRSFTVCNEIAENFPKMDEAHLLYLSERYGMTYYLVEKERPELASKQVVNIGKYYLYSFTETQN